MLPVYLEGIDVDRQDHAQDEPLEQTVLRLNHLNTVHTRTTVLKIAIIHVVERIVIDHLLYLISCIFDKLNTHAHLSLSSYHGLYPRFRYDARFSFLSPSYCLRLARLGCFVV